MLAPALRMIMMGDGKSGIVKFSKEGKENAEIVISKDELSSAKGHSNVYVEGEGLFTFINKPNGKKIGRASCRERG